MLTSISRENYQVFRQMAYMYSGKRRVEIKGVHIGSVRKIQMKLLLVLCFNTISVLEEKNTLDTWP